MTSKYTGPCIISGYIKGRKFRPSNWSERVAESGGVYHQDTRVLEYVPHLRPIYHDEYGHCIYVNFDTLAVQQPGVYDYLVWFIESNGLEVIPLTGGPHEHTQGENQFEAA